MENAKKALLKTWVVINPRWEMKMSKWRKIAYFFLPKYVLFGLLQNIGYELKPMMTALWKIQWHTSGFQKNVSGQITLGPHCVDTFLVTVYRGGKKALHCNTETLCQLESTVEGASWFSADLLPYDVALLSSLREHWIPDYIKASSIKRNSENPKTTKVVKKRTRFILCSSHFSLELHPINMLWLERDCLSKTYQKTGPEVCFSETLTKSQWRLQQMCDGGSCCWRRFYEFTSFLFSRLACKWLLMYSIKY